MRSFSALHGKDSCRVYSRGSAGLHALFSGIRETAGSGEVVLPGFCCETVALAAIFAGLTPVFADIDPASLSPGLVQVEKVLSGSTRAVVVVHLFGCDADAERFLPLKEGGRKICLVEDIAHAVGGRAKDGRLIGSHLDFTMASLADDKILSGAAGLIMAAPGQDPPLRLPGNGKGNRKLSEVDINVLGSALRNAVHAVADLWRAGRYTPAGTYRTEFWQAFRSLIVRSKPGLIPSCETLDASAIEKSRRARINRCLAYIEGIRNRHVKPVSFRPEWNCWRLPVLCSSSRFARELTQKLRSHGISASNHYFPLNLLFGRGSCPVTEDIASRIINLWVDNTVNMETIRKTIKLINAS